MTVPLALLLVLALLLRGLWDAPAGPDPEPPPRDVVAAAAPLPAMADAPPSEATRTGEVVPQLPAEDPTPIALDLPHQFTLRLRVVDTYGVPVDQAHLFLAPALGAFAACADATDTRGELTFACRGRRDTLTLWAAVMAYGSIEPLQQWTLRAGIVERRTVAVHGRRSDPAALLELLARFDHRPDDYRDSRLNWALRDAHRAAEASKRSGRVVRRDAIDVFCGRELFLFREIECRSCHDASTVAGYQPLRWADTLRPTLHPDRVFGDLLLQAPSTREHAELERELGSRKADAYDERLGQEHGLDRVGAIYGRVLTRDAVPVPDVPVVWLDGNGAVRQRCTTNDDGRYRMILPGGLACSVTVFAGPLGRAETLCTTVATGEAEYDFYVGAQSTFAGRAVDATSAPLANAIVRWYGSGSGDAAVTNTDKDGNFAFSHLTENGRCMLWTRDQDLLLPIAQSPVMAPDSRDIALRLSAAMPTRARLRLHPRLPAGYARARVEVRLLQVDTGVGTHVEAGSFDDAFDLNGLAAGQYVGEIGAQGLGFVPFGPIHVDGHGLWDVGVLELQPPGRVRFELAADTQSPLDLGCQFFRQRDDLDLLTPWQAMRDGRVALPPGDYVLMWRVPDKVHRRRVRVTSNAETVVAIGP